MILLGIERNSTASPDLGKKRLQAGRPWLRRRLARVALLGGTVVD
jgi:hypothetical protein